MKSCIAVLASGGGTTTETLIRAGQQGYISFEVGLVIYSRKDAGIVQRIADLNKEFGLNIPCVLINSKTHPAADGEDIPRGAQTAAEEEAILELLHKGNFDLVALIGYMKRTGSRLVADFGWRPEYSSIYQARMVNTHPGLLPETRAMHGEQIQQYVLDNKLPNGGHTLHVVSEDYDDGPVIAEHMVAVEPNDTTESLFQRVQIVEKQYLPLDMEAFIKGRKEYLARQKVKS